jgi:hypothetical protein
MHYPTVKKLLVLSKKVMDFGACERKEIVGRIKEMSEIFTEIPETENGSSRFAVKCFVHDRSHLTW